MTPAEASERRGTGFAGLLALSPSGGGRKPQGVGQLITQLPLAPSRT